VIHAIKRRGRIHRVRWKQGQNRRMQYPRMGQNKIKEIKIEGELKGREKQEGFKKICLTGYVPSVMNTETMLESLSQKLLI